MSAQGPYRDGDVFRDVPAPMVSRPVPWKRYGLSVMACSGIAAGANAFSGIALNHERAEPLGIEAIRWIFVACFAVFAVGASVAVCAEIRGDK